MRSSSEPGRRRLRATATGALVEGWRRVLRAPVVTLAVWVLTIVLALPLSWQVAEAIRDHLGSSTSAERILQGWEPEWVAEFTSGGGLLATFTREVLGFGGTLATLSRVLDGQWPPAELAGTLLAYAAVWLFLTGGILDRYARARTLRARQFFAACGTHFFRFVRQALFILPCYWVAFGYLHPLLFERVYAATIRDLTEERDVIAVRAMLYVAFVCVLAAINVVADFAKVRTVVEDRRSALAALAASLRFIRRRPGRVAWLYILNILAALVIARLWLQVAPAADAATWVVLLAGQAYILLRLVARLGFLASEVVFFQGELAHAQYAAPLEPLWPDSPSAEALQHLRG